MSSRSVNPRLCGSYALGSYRVHVSILMKLCGQYLDLDRAFGVSIGWACPGWGNVLGRLSQERANAILRALDRVAYHVPRAADYILSVWKPRTWAPSNPR